MYFPVELAAVSVLIRVAGVGGGNLGSNDNGSGRIRYGSSDRPVIGLRSNRNIPSKIIMQLATKIVFACRTLEFLSL